MAGLVLCGTYTDPTRQAGFPVTPERPVMGMVGPTGSEGIYVFRRDPSTGALTLLNASAAAANPSFLILDPTGRYVFAVSEVQDFEGTREGGVFSFALDAGTGALRLLSQVRSGGGNPCHLSMSTDGRFLLVANHQAGTLAVLPVSPDGVLADPVHVHVDQATDDRQPHSHYIQPDPRGGFVLSTNTTTDRISVFRQDAITGRLSPHDPPWESTHSGGSPRHLSFTPDGEYLLANGEADLTLSLFRFDGAQGRLDYLDRARTVADDTEVTGHSTAQLLVHASGRYAYVANRGSDTIAIFAIDRTSGTLHRIGLQPTFGRTPRNFQIDPSGSQLYVANQNSNAVECFGIDPATGLLDHRGRVAAIPAPTCIQFG